MAIMSPMKYDELVQLHAEIITPIYEVLKQLFSNSSKTMESQNGCIH